MNFKLLISVIVIVLVIVLVIWYFYFVNFPQSFQPGYSNQSGQKKSNVPSDKTAPADATADITDEFNRLPSDDSVDNNLELLDQNINVF